MLMITTEVLVSRGQNQNNINALMEFEKKSIHKSMSIFLHYSNIWFYYWELLSIKGDGDSSSFTEGVVLKRRILLSIPKY